MAVSASGACRMNAASFSFSSGVKKGFVQLAAHLCELGGVFRYAGRVVPDGAGKGLLTGDAAEADADTLPVRDQFAGFGGGDAYGIDLLRDKQLVQRLFPLAGVVELDHHVRVGLVVVAAAVGAFSGIVVVGQVNPDRLGSFFHINA